MRTSHATLSGIGAATVITTLGAVGASALIGGRRTGFGNASANSPENAACSEKLQIVLNAAGKLAEERKPATVKIAGYTDADFVYQGGMKGKAELVGRDYRAIHEYMRSLGWDYSEHPNCSKQDHWQGTHCEVIWDPEIKQYAFRFINHASEEALDSDRGRLLSDRQRNEMKTQTNYEWRRLNGNWNEWQRLKWKFRIPKGFRPSTSFCHLHQLKAQEGNNGAPLITISTRCDADGGNRRVQVIHTGDVRSSSKGILVDNLPMTDFEDEWIQVETEMQYTHHGTFRIKMTRVRDGKMLVDQSFSDVDLWRRGAINIRNKFGIYRSFGRRMKSASDRPNNGIKDETLSLADFEVYEAYTENNPQPHE